MIDWQTVFYALFAVTAWLLFTWQCLRAYRLAQPSEGDGRGDVLVTYASQSGRALGIAQRLATSLPDGARLLPLNRLDIDSLQSARQLYCIAATYGEGEAPDNAARFLSQFTQAALPDLSSLRYQVLALGDREYPHFCAYGHQLDAALAGAGAECAVNCAEIDCGTDQMAQAVDQWLGAIVGEAVTAEAAHGYGEFLPWTLQSRRCVNEGSPGAPMYALRLSPPATQAVDWQAGAIAEIRLSGSAMRAREYSIASLPQSESVELLVRLQYDEHGQAGMASGYLCEQMALGEYVELKLRANPLFATPEGDTPLILIGAGSGLAGLWGHLEARRQSGYRQNWLVYGERSPACDRAYADQIAELERDAYLPGLDLCFSRAEQNAAYVQEVLRQRALAVQDWVSRGAVIMVCGSRDGMAGGVDAALREVLGTAGVEQLENDGRYRRDVY